MHGDIRAFNIVFGKKAGEGWLLDLDFGGEAGEATYPPNSTIIDWRTDYSWEGHPISSQSSTTIMHYGTS